MTKKSTVNFNMLEKKIMVLDEYVKSHSLSMNANYNTIEGLQEYLNEGEELARKIRKIATSIKREVESNVEAKKDRIIAQAVLEKSPEELIELSNKLKAEARNK